MEEKAIKIFENKEFFIRYIIGRFGLGRDMADDYFSEVIRRLCEKGILLEVHDGYIIACIHNLIWDTRSRKKKVKEIYVEDLRTFDDQFGIDLFSGRFLAYKDIRKDVHKLKYKDKECLILKFNFKMNQREIAKYLGISRGTVAPRIMKAQKGLRNKVVKDIIDW